MFDMPFKEKGYSKRNKIVPKIEKEKILGRKYTNVEPYRLKIEKFLAGVI